MIRFETKLNADSTKQLNRFALKRMLIPLLIVSLAFVALGLTGYFTAEDIVDKILGIVFLVLAVLIIPLSYSLSLLLQKFFNTSAKFISNGTNEFYEFEENKVHIHQIGATFESTVIYDYCHFYKIFETKTHYFLYVSRQQCHIIPKSCITDGTVDELNSMLRQRIGINFKQKK